MTPWEVLSLDAVIELTGLSRSSVFRKMRNGTFPAKTNQGSRPIGWARPDIDRWIAAQPRTISGSYQRSKPGPESADA